MHTCTRLALETEEEEHNETEEEEEARTRTRTRTRTRVGSSEEACEIGRTARSWKYVEKEQVCMPQGNTICQAPVFPPPRWFFLPAHFHRWAIENTHIYWDRDRDWDREREAYWNQVLWLHYGATWLFRFLGFVGAFCNIIRRNCEIFWTFYWRNLEMLLVCLKKLWEFGFFFFFVFLSRLCWKFEISTVDRDIIPWKEICNVLVN